MNDGILLFEDKLGITAGYEEIWAGLLLKSKLSHVRIHRRNAYKALGDSTQLLIRKGNRNAPGFNEDRFVQDKITRWVSQQINQTQPALVICMDPALLFLANPDWNQASLDNLRGGHYTLAGRPFMIMFGISAWHTKKNEKDIARLNSGYSDKEEWEADHGGDESDAETQEMIWIDPISVPYGKFVLQKDLEKIRRVYTCTVEKGD